MACVAFCSEGKKSEWKDERSLQRRDQLSPFIFPSPPCHCPEYHVEFT